MIKQQIYRSLCLASVVLLVGYGIYRRVSSYAAGATAPHAADSPNKGDALQEAAPKAIFLAPGGGRVIQEVGDGPKGQLTFKLGSGEEGSTFEFAEGKTVPNGGPPEHIHLDTDEAFYVVSGTFSVKVGEQLKEVGPGSFVFAPRGVPHVYVNTGKTEGTLLTVASPTKWEAYMREATDALRHMPPGQLDQKILNAISDKYKVRIVGPPLGSGVQLELPRKP